MDSHGPDLACQYLAGQGGVNAVLGYVVCCLSKVSGALRQIADLDFNIAPPDELRLLAALAFPFAPKPRRHAAARAIDV